MPCFDAEDVIFITNKWDSIRSQFDVKKEREELWKTIKMDLKKKMAQCQRLTYFQNEFFRC